MLLVNDENNFPHKLLLTNTQVSKFCKAFANNSLANIKWSKSQFHEIEQSGGFLGRFAFNEKDIVSIGWKRFNTISISQQQHQQQMQLFIRKCLDLAQWH